MRKVLALLLLLPALALAQSGQGNQPGSSGSWGQIPLGYRNESGAVLCDTEGDDCRIAVNRYGQPMCSLYAGAEQLTSMPVSNAVDFNGIAAPLYAFGRAGQDLAEAASTTTVINATAHIARVGDTVQFSAGTTGNIQVSSPVCAVAANSITVCNAFPLAPNIGDTFIIWRPSPISTSAPLGLTAQIPSLMTAVEYSGQYSTTGGLLKAEDQASANGDALVAIGVRSLGTNAFGPSISTSNDYSTLDTDVDNRVAVNAMGAQPSQFFNACSTAAVTTNTTQTLVAADATRRYYISSWGCTNTGAAATQVVLEDSDGTDLDFGMLAATTGNFDRTKGLTPTRAPLINKALQINVITTGSATMCCVNGFASVN